MKARVFAHSRLDSLLVLVALGQFVVLAYGVASLGTAAPAVSLGLGALCVFLMCTNFQCVSHNFIHNPFFVRKGCNTAFGMFNSLLLGEPQCMVRIFHLNHHKYNNDLPDPATGTTGDASSTWRHGEPPKREECFLRYSLLGYFRTEVGSMLRVAKKKGWDQVVYRELAATLFAVAALAVVNPLGVVGFLLPVWLLGNIGAQAMNYLEHYGAIPGNRQTDSVSSYGRFYNLIWFNNGYHQEHHYRPQIHWSNLPGLRKLLPPESERRVVWGAMWFNFGPVHRPADLAQRLPKTATVAARV